jgi:hypothetical protein
MAGRGLQSGAVRPHTCTDHRRVRSMAAPCGSGVCSVLASQCMRLWLLGREWARTCRPTVSFPKMFSRWSSCTAVTFHDGNDFVDYISRSSACPCSVHAQRSRRGTCGCAMLRLRPPPPGGAPPPQVSPQGGSTRRAAAAACAPAAPTWTRSGAEGVRPAMVAAAPDLAAAAAAAAAAGVSPLG